MLQNETSPVPAPTESSLTALCLLSEPVLIQQPLGFSQQWLHRDQRGGFNMPALRPSVPTERPRPANLGWTLEAYWALWPKSRQT